MKSGKVFLLAALALLSILASCGAQGKDKAGSSDAVAGKKVTFIELGSVKCVPCRAMVPVMEEVETKYADQVAVVFYDVWTKEGEPYGAKYRIRVIPTQIFLDADGKEYFRHEGFFPYEELVKILEQGGVNL
jgi:thioredoxin 1